MSSGSGSRSGGLFVTGTDTGVGKTTVACALIRAARRLGRHPVPFKPVETGCAPDPDDARRLWEAARPPARLAEICMYALPLAAAPAQAAAAAGVTIDVGAIAARAALLAARGDLLVVEGAGGLLVPYVEAVTAADLAARLALPVLVVGRTALGTVNHTALTVRELARRGLTLAGIILVMTDPVPGPHQAGNAALIETLTGVRPLGTLPYLERVERQDPDALADALLAALGEQTVESLIASR
jgi:dethiobiotin synthetase